MPDAFPAFEIPPVPEHCALLSSPRSTLRRPQATDTRPGHGSVSVVARSALAAREDRRAQRARRARGPSRAARSPRARTSAARRVAHPPRHPRLQRPEVDEPGGRGLLEQAAGLREGGELRVVDGVRRAARDDACGALVEPDADLAGHVRRWRRSCRRRGPRAAARTRGPRRRGRPTSGQAPS